MDPLRQTAIPETNFFPEIASFLPSADFQAIPASSPRSATTLSLQDRLKAHPPVEILDEIKTNLTATVQRIQKNNVVISLSTLQSALLALIDDNTLPTLNKCLEELRQANLPQSTLSSHAFAWLVTEEKNDVTDLKELFQLCMKVIKEFLPYLAGRSGHHSREYFCQNFEWRGWKQQAQQIRVHNNALKRLLAQAKAESSHNNAIMEIECFAEAIEVIIDSFQKEKYPDIEVISYIYERNSISHPFPVKELPTKEPTEEVST